ncbi:MAG: hypothetical protein IJS46_02695 [Kiritimatiellae bacterium]|nr:hypothetical protein [Kiritimatiellia bacterium]
MQEELQPLLEKIQSEGIAKANAAAAEIVAKAEAARIVSEAEKKASETAQEAQDAAAKLTARAEESLRQATRDVMLKLRGDIDRTFEGLLLRDVSAALSDKGLLARCIESAIAGLRETGETGGGEVHVAAADADAVAAALLSSAVAKAGSGEGFSVEASDGVSAGFRLFLKDGRVEHDFTAEAIRDALAASIRPALAKIVFASKD